MYPCEVNTMTEVVRPKRWANAKFDAATLRLEAALLRKLAAESTTKDVTNRLVATADGMDQKATVLEEAIAQLPKVAKS
jgi:hypothetical protein